MDDITSEPCRGAIGDLRAFQQTGMETFRHFIRGRLPGPPMSRLLGLHATDVGLGKATFAMPVTRWLEDGFGLCWGGVYALLADGSLACAIWTTLPAGQAATTSELSLSFVRPITRDTTSLVARAETIHVSRDVGLSTVLITDQEGRMLAFGSTRCLIANVPVPSGELPVPDLGPSEPPDPWRRPAPEDGYFTLDEVLNGVPLELQQQTTSGRKIVPVWRLTGYRTTSVEDGRATGRLPSSPWFSNGSTSIYGGMLAWAAEFTMGAAVYATLGAGDIFGTLDMHIRFTRPALIDTGDLTFNATVQHRGRRLRVSACEVDNAQGQRVAMATSSALVIEGGARELTKGRLPDEILADAARGQHEE